VLADGRLAYVSRYALGRDYHKTLRRALATLATELQQRIGPFGYRVCVDTAPVLEKALAANAGLGWIGKHTNLIARERGSWFFLGEILTDLPLPVDERAGAHCGSCQACIPAAPPCDRRPVAAGCAALHFLSHHRAPQAPFRSSLRKAIAIASTAVTTASSVCPWNKFRARGGAPGFQGAPWPGCPQRCRSCFAGARRSSRSACVARPSTASATSAVAQSRGGAR